MPRTFHLLRTLGQGAHGAVHLAEMRDEEDFVQTLAIKRLLPEWSENADLVARLKDEARLLAMLRHEHVVRVHGLTRIDGGLAILMEPIEGTDLGRILQQSNALEPRVVLEVVEAVADALDAAYRTVPPGKTEALAVVHRDIKPSNIMLTQRGGVKVMDFGVAQATFDTREGQTKSQQYGTARYMAPERWLHGTADHKSDVFALGITLVEAASGTAVPRLRLSDEGFSADLAEALKRVPWQPLRDMAETLLAFSPHGRPDAQTVAQRCRALLPEAPGPTLRNWSAAHVLVESGTPLDPTCTATIMREDSESRGPIVTGPIVTTVPLPPRIAPGRANHRGWVLAAIGLFVLGLGLLAISQRPVIPSVLPAETPVVADAQPHVLEPAPALVVLPEPVPEPVSVPIPVPVRVAPVPVPPPEPPPVALARVKFVLASGLTAETDWGHVTQSPGALELPASSTVVVRVHEGDTTWRCTIAVGESVDQVHIRRRADGGCSQ